ncbi:hypothetical protein B0H14DRAFT_3519004 [Mycena olivaceomarginata]|nr:hypothetical protein B0H14DRAFT_3519004 [Mycena olivaceomarginata]
MSDFVLANDLPRKYKKQRWSTFPGLCEPVFATEEDTDVFFTQSEVAFPGLRNGGRQTKPKPKPKAAPVPVDGVMVTVPVAGVTTGTPAAAPVPVDGVVATVPFAGVTAGTPAGAPVPAPAPASVPTTVAAPVDPPASPPAPNSPIAPDDQGNVLVPSTPEDVVPLVKPRLKPKRLTMKRKLTNHEGNDAAPPSTKQRLKMGDLIGSDEEEANDPDADMSDDPIESNDNGGSPTPSDVEEATDPDADMPDDIIEEQKQQNGGNPELGYLLQPAAAAQFDIEFKKCRCQSSVFDELDGSST